jgi:hypothetical protein
MDETPYKSTSAKPDLNWSQVKETVLMLNVAVSHIERTMRDGDDSINTLVESFTPLVGKTQIIHKAAENLPETDEKSTILGNCRDISAKMNGAIVALQFYDKLSQRLSHISHALGSMAELVHDSKRLFDPYEWHGLQQMIKSKYTNEPDRDMFDAILNGASVEEALKLAENQKSADSDKFPLEFFNE